MFYNRFSFYNSNFTVQVSKFGLRVTGRGLVINSKFFRDFIEIKSFGNFVRQLVGLPFGDNNLVQIHLW